MPTRSARYYSIALVITDFLMLLAAFTLAYVIRVQLDPRPLVAEVRAMEFFIEFLAISPVWIFIFAVLGLYKSIIYNRRLAEWGRLFVGAFVGILIILGYAFVVDEPFFPARLVAVYAFVGSFVLLVFGREILRLVRSILFRFGVGVSRVLVIGNSDATYDIADNLSNTPKSGYDIVAVAGPKRVVPERINAEHYTTVEAALKSLDDDRITTIIQTDLYDSSERNQRILGAAQERHINYNFVPGEAEFYSGKNTVDVFLGYPIISVYQTPLVGWGEIAKRIFDLVFGTLAVIILSPVFLILIILQKVFNPGPAFYVSKRLTRYSVEFDFYKFRSMGAKFGGRDAAEEFRDMGRDDLVEEYEKTRKVVDDPRITRFGKFLRNTSLDELPQFFNVIKGDLSLVGPRPILPQELPHYRGRGALLHSVKSGVTGLWQVSGRSDLPFEKRVELELYYAQNWSFWLDIKILFRTIRVWIFRSGAR
jgi:exopolysaccharide biosynthesis polyprenyl glycosylphosphotransferase